MFPSKEEVFHVAIIAPIFQDNFEEEVEQQIREICRDLDNPASNKVLDTQNEIDLRLENDSSARFDPIEKDFSVRFDHIEARFDDLNRMMTIVTSHLGVK